MPLQFACPQCQKKLNIPESAGGLKIKCPACGKVFVAPGARTIPAAPRPEQPAAATNPAPPVGHPDQDTSRLSELDLNELPNRGDAGNPLQETGPASKPAAKGGRQIFLRVLVIFFCLLGAASSGFLGKIWLDTIAKEKAKINELAMFVEAMGGEQALAQANERLRRLGITSYLLLAAGALGLVCGVRACSSKGLLPGLIILLAITSPLVLFATSSAEQIKESPMIFLFFAPLVVAGLLCLPLRARRAPEGKKELIFDIPLGLAGLAVLGVAIYTAFLSGVPLPGQPFRAPDDRAPGDKPSIFSLVGNDERSTIPPRGQEELRGAGVAKPEEDVQQLARALSALDVAAYREWLKSDPAASEDFERLIRFEGKFGGQPPDEAARLVLDSVVRNKLLGAQAWRTPAQIDGDYAIILIVTRSVGGPDSTYRKLAYKKKDERWHRIGEASGEFAKLEPPLNVPAAEMIELFAPDARLQMMDLSKVVREGGKKLPTTAAEAQTLVKQVCQKAIFDDKGQLVSLDGDFVFASEPAFTKAIFMLMSPEFKDTTLRLAVPGIDDADLAKLAKLTKLEQLNLASDQNRFTDKGLASLAGMTNLAELDINAPLATDAWLAHLKDKTKLQSLKVRSRVTDAGLAHLAGLSALTSLDLKGNYLKGPGLAHLKGLGQLATLNLSANGLGNAGLDHLAALASLSNLYLAHNFIDDAGLKNLSGLASLDTLDLDDNRVGDAGLEHLRGMTKLRTLILSENRVAGAGLAHVKALGKDGAPFSGHLSFEHNPVDAAGVTHLSTLRKGGANLNLDEDTLAKVQAQLRTEPHRGDVLALAFTADGGKLVSTGGYGEIKVWDVAGQSVHNTINGDESANFNSVALSADGQSVAVGVSNVEVWNLQTGKREHEQFVRGNIRTLAYLPSRNTLLIGTDWYSDDHIGLTLWDVGGEKERYLTSVPCQVKVMALAADGKNVATASFKENENKVIKLWSLADPDKPRSLEGHVDEVLALARTPAGQIVSGSKDRTIKIWDPASGKVVSNLQGHDDAVTALAVSRDGKLLASGGQDKTVRLWDLTSGKEIATITDLPIPIRAVALSPDGKTLAAGGSAYTGYNKPKAKAVLKMWNVAEAVKSFAPGSRPDNPLLALKRIGAHVDFEGDVPVRVFMSDNKLYDKDVALLSSLKTLRSVGLSSKNFTDACLPHVAKLTQLEKLTIGSFGGGYKITDAGLAQLAPLVNLTELDLHGLPIDGSGLNALKGATGLRSLGLSDSKITDAGLAALANFPNLESLGLSSTPITGSGLGALKGAAKLRNINLYDCKSFGDAGLEQLKDMTSLEGLFLKQTAVTDAGLMHLTKLTRLRSLDIEDTKATAAGVRKLRVAQAAGDPVLFIRNLGGRVNIDEGAPASRWLPPISARRSRRPTWPCSRSSRSSRISSCAASRSRMKTLPSSPG